jgi:glycosyltransferase involved in cell wall biosynthesis
MKRIGIDARLAFQTGVGVYIRNFLHYLQRMSLPSDIEFFIYAMKRDVDKLAIHHPQLILREAESRWHSFDEQLTFYNTLMNDHLDLMHFTYFGYPVRYKRPFIATVHDVTPLIFKTGKASTLNPLFYELKYHAFKYVISQQVHHAQKIITPTIAVKNQLIEIYGSDIEKKTDAIYEGMNYEMIDQKENSSLKKEFSEPYLLYVGNFYPHKNVDVFLDAYQLLEKKVPLVMLGPDNYFSGELKKRIDHEKIKGITIIHTPNTADLIFFYKHAIALVNPSLSEGFGLPLVEAAYYGCPIVASDLPVFKELYGDTYISFDPHSVSDIKEKVQQVIDLRPKGEYTHVLKKFSFEKMTKEILGEYLTLLHKS